MKQFDVFVQNKFYKTMSAVNVGKILPLVANDIKEGLVPGFDNSKNQDIKIVPKNWNN